MLPGKKYNAEDLVAVLRKRIWWVLIPFALVSAGTAAVARKLPDRYYSEATVRVVPQQVPDQYVKPQQNESIQDRLMALQATVLSRTKLERVINELNLYPEERDRGIMEDIYQQMRNDISYKVEKGDVFKVGYTGSNPRTVQAVATQLAGFFVNGSQEDQQNFAEGTSQFLAAQVEDARRRLVEKERELQDYRTKFSGQLPTQLESNLQAQVNLQGQIRELADAINQAQARHLLFESQAKDLESQAPGAEGSVSVPALSAAGDAVQGGTLVQQLEFVKAQLALMQKHYTDAQPDVRRLKGLVADLQAKVDADALTRPVSAEPTPAVSSMELARQKKLKDTRDQIAQLDKQIAAAQAETKQLRASYDDLQRRIDAVPARESQMTELMRDYQTLTHTYNDLLVKLEDSKLVADLQTRQKGEQFRVLDQPRIPERPNSPNRPLINLGGMGAGLAIGLLLVALLEYRDRSFKTDEEIISLLALPVLAVVPIMESNDERRQSRRRRFYLGVGLGSTVVGCLAILIYTFVR